MDPMPNELPLGLALAWGVAPEPTRGPKRELSVERIVAEAIAIADKDGLLAVSMSAVARACGVTTMALYRYLPSKDDLVLLMSDAAVSAPPSHAPDHDWREALTAWALGHVHVLLEHPWLLEVPLHNAPATPNSIAWGEAGLAALDGTNLTTEEKLAIILEVNAHSRLSGTLLRRWDGAPSAYDAGWPQALAHLIDAERFPRYAAATLAPASPSDEPEFDLLDFGLNLLLDGIAQRITARQSQA